MKKLIRSKLDAYFAPFARKSDIDNLYAQLAALIEIKGIIGPRMPIGPLRGWALSPDAIATILRDVIERNAPKVLEFGAGESTIVIGAALKNAGGGSLTTVEHDLGFADEIQARLSKNGLSDYVRLRTVSMCEYASFMGLQKLKSYDLAELELDFDIAIVDGPIAGQFGAATRAVPLDWCVTRLKSDSVIYLDDAARPGEMEVISRIKLAHEKVEAKFFRTEKGLCRFAAIS